MFREVGKEAVKCCKIAWMLFAFIFCPNRVPYFFLRISRPRPLPYCPIVHKQTSLRKRSARSSVHCSGVQISGKHACSQRPIERSAYMYCLRTSRTEIHGPFKPCHTPRIPLRSHIATVHVEAHYRFIPRPSRKNVELPESLPDPVVGLPQR